MKLWLLGVAGGGREPVKGFHQNQLRLEPPRGKGLLLSHSYRGRFLKCGSHLIHCQIVICVIYSRLWSLIGHTFADTETGERLKESAAHSPPGRCTLSRASSRAAPQAAATPATPAFSHCRSPGPQILLLPLPPQVAGADIFPKSCARWGCDPWRRRSPSARCKATFSLELVHPRPRPGVRLGRATQQSLGPSPTPPAQRGLQQVQPLRPPYNQGSPGAVGCGRRWRIAQSLLGVLAPPLAAKLQAGQPASPRRLSPPQQGPGAESRERRENLAQSLRLALGSGC
nr:uncharacterized protein LOC112422953 [Macaca nemestrina]